MPAKVQQKFASAFYSNCTPSYHQIEKLAELGRRVPAPGCWVSCARCVSSFSTDPEALSRIRRKSSFSGCLRSAGYGTQHSFPPCCATIPKTFWICCARPASRSCGSRMGWRNSLGRLAAGTQPVATPVCGREASAPAPHLRVDGLQSARSRALHGMEAVAPSPS